MVERRIWIFFAGLAVLVGLLLYFSHFTLNKPSPKFIPYQGSQQEAPIGYYYTLYNQNNKVLMQTGLPLSVGDEFIDSDNTHYRIGKVSDWEAFAEVVEKSTVAKAPKYSNIARAQAAPRVGLYCTHSDECFTPTQGVPSLPGKGAVFRVAEAIVEPLVSAGITVDINYNTHDPHDAHAYMRSRRTVFQLLKLGPDAIFDIHRDSAPSEAYFTYITGVESAKVMIVVGRQNPNIQQNIDFAKRIKDRADQVYPGLVRGIFIGRGNYNQDLHPRALLFEIGTERLPEQLALDAARCLGDVLSTVLKEL